LPRLAGEEEKGGKQISAINAIARMCHSQGCAGKWVVQRGGGSGDRGSHCIIAINTVLG